MTMQWLIDNIWLVLFFLWGLPLGYYRSRFRKVVYQTDSWLINIKPLFWKELKGLFGNMYPDVKVYRKERRFYIVYLFIYMALVAAYMYYH